MLLHPQALHLLVFYWCRGSHRSCGASWQKMRELDMRPYQLGCMRCQHPAATVSRSLLASSCPPSVRALLGLSLHYSAAAAFWPSHYPYCCFQYMDIFIYHVTILTSFSVPHLRVQTRSIHTQIHTCSCATSVSIRLRAFVSLSLSLRLINSFFLKETYRICKSLYILIFSRIVYIPCIFSHFIFRNW